MNKGQRVIACLLAVVAAMLVVNVIVVGARRADAGTGAGEPEHGGEPQVVKYLSVSNNIYLRVWSDAQVDMWTSPPNELCDWAFQGVLLGPLDYPFPVVDAHTADPSVVIMEFADGRIDFGRFAGDQGRCTLAGEGSDPYCMGDVDRSGDTDITDLLFVLADWGECDP